MAKIDPNTYEDKGTDGKKCGPGQKVLAAIAVERGKAQSGAGKLDVRWICVKDLSAPNGDGDKGASQWDTFTLSDAALWRMGQVSKAIGWAQPFDTDVDKEVGEVFTSGYVVATIANENGQDGKVRPKVKRYDPYTGGEEGDWPDLIAAAEASHAEFRKKNPAGKPRPASGGGGGSSGGGGGGYNDEVPF